MNENLELLIATDNTSDRWEYEERPVYDTDAIEEAYREEMYTDEGRALLNSAANKESDQHL